MTYGDGLANVDVAALIAFHRSHGRAATLSAVVPSGRYGALDLDGSKVNRFHEKPPGDNTLVNGGYFVLQPSVLDRIAGDQTAWETDPLEGLARDGELMAFRHTGFWQPMDTLREKEQLETAWASGQAPWKVWP
jgi:glucose-1-phosphate cytidylyltransferase